MSDLFLYHIWVDEFLGYDTYDSAVVAATCAAEAQNTHPSGDQKSWEETYNSWVMNPSQVRVELIGTADASVVSSGVIVSSYNAG